MQGNAHRVDSYDPALVRNGGEGAIGMKRFVLAAAVCGAVAFFAAGDALALDNEIWIFDNRFPFCEKRKDL